MTQFIAYSSSTPNPPNDPADDVATMQFNAAAISTIIAVDHVGFNLTGGGQHNKITFNANAAVVPPVSPPVLFTSNDAFALPQLFYYTGNAAHSSNQYTLTGTNCSTMVFGGIIIKWGSAAFVGSQSPVVTFTNAFPNNIFTVHLSLLNTNATAPTRNTVSTATTAGFTANVQASGSSTWYWFAIGN